MSNPLRNAGGEELQRNKQMHESIHVEQRHEEQLDQSRGNLQRQREEEADKKKDIEEQLPPVLQGSVHAPKQSIKPAPSQRYRDIFSAYGHFTEIKASDSKKMKAVKAALQNYQAHTEGGHTGLLNDIDNLDMLISACRWYNASRWSLKSRARERQKDVKGILDIAKRERARLSRLDKKYEKQDSKYKKDQRKEAKKIKKETENSSQIELIYNNKKYSKDYFGGKDSETTPASKLWAGFKAYTFGFIGRNLLNIGMGAVAGAAWLATYPVAAAYAKMSGKSKYYKGFNIKIPRPQSPQGWYNYYNHEQRHVTAAMGRKTSFWGAVGQFALRIPHYNLWDPIKHIVTLDMKHLSGNSYVSAHKKENELADHMRGEADNMMAYMDSERYKDEKNKDFNDDDNE